MSSRLFKLLFLLFFSFILFSCSSVQQKNHFQYSIECLNCDENNSLLKFELVNYVEKDTLIKLTITNLSDELIFIDKSMLVTSIDGYVKYYRLGDFDPLLTISTSASSSSSVSKTTPFVYDYLGSINSYDQTFSNFGSITYYENLRKYIIIPKKMKRVFYLQNLYYDVYLRLYKQSITNEGKSIAPKEVDLSLLKDKVSNLPDKMHTYTFVYKKLNNDKWISKNLNVKVKDFRLFFSTDSK